MFDQLFDELMFDFYHGATTKSHGSRTNVWYAGRSSTTLAFEYLDESRQNARSGRRDRQD